MGDHRSPEEVEAERLAVLGSDLGPLFHALDNEVTWLHTKWKEFRQLFASPSTVDLLNEIAPFFFRVIQDTLWYDALLHVARLTDPETSMRKNKKRNLTLLRLPAALPPGPLSDEVRELVDKAVSSSSFARDWRNRLLAHSDLDLALGTSAEPLATASRQHMEDALTAMRNVLNAVNRHYWNSSTAYANVLSVHNAESLLYYLRAARKAEKKQKDRWSRGIVLPEDFEPED